MRLIGSVRNIKISCDFKSSIIINLKASDYEFTIYKKQRFFIVIRISQDIFVEH